MMVEVSGESSTEPDKLTVLNDVAEENAKETLIEVEIGDETNHLEPPSVVSNETTDFENNYMIDTHISKCRKNMVARASI